jgi:hypothetical protein
VLLSRPQWALKAITNEVAKCSSLGGRPQENYVLGNLSLLEGSTEIEGSPAQISALKRRWVPLCPLNK